MNRGINVAPRIPLMTRVIRFLHGGVIAVAVTVAIAIAIAIVNVAIRQWRFIGSICGAGSVWLPLIRGRHLYVLVLVPSIRIYVIYHHTVFGTVSGRIFVYLDD